MQTSKENLFQNLFNEYGQISIRYNPTYALYFTKHSHLQLSLHEVNQAFICLISVVYHGLSLFRFLRTVSTPRLDKRWPENIMITLWHKYNDLFKLNFLTLVFYERKKKSCRRKQWCGSGSGRIRIHLGPRIKIPNPDPENEGKSRVWPTVYCVFFSQEIIFFKSEPKRVANL